MADPAAPTPVIKNSMSIFCRHCGCTILRPQKAELVTRDIPLPCSNSADDHEVLSRHWFVKDMMNFENIAFSKTVGSTKYLTCAECELGIVGVQLLNEDKKIFVAHSDRVSYDAAAAAEKQARMPPSPITAANLSALLQGQTGEPPS